MVGVQMPDGASLERTGASLDEVSKIAQATPGVRAGHRDRRHLDPRQQRGPGQCRRRLRHPERLGRPRQERRARTCARSSCTSAQACQGLQDGRTFLLVPPPIQGIGNAGGFQMQIEQRDGSFDLAKLQDVTDAMHRAGRAPRARSANADHPLPRRRAAHRGRRRPLQGRDAEGLASAMSSTRSSAYLGSTYVNQVQQVRPQPAGLSSRPIRQYRAHPEDISSSTCRSTRARWCRSARWPSCSRRRGRR